MAKQRHIVVDDDTWNQLYAIKGPHRTFKDAIQELIEAVFPSEKDQTNQSKLKCCPACGEFTIVTDEDGLYYCNNPSCQYEPEEGEL